MILFLCVYVFFVLEMFKYIELVYLFGVLELFSVWRLKNQFLFMFTGGVKCCTFLFIDVIVCRLVCVFCAVVSFLILDVDVFKEGLLCTLIFHRYSKEGYYDQGIVKDM
jgi:hypothetical protein